jgi:hypothetical protein
MSRILKSALRTVVHYSQEIPCFALSDNLLGDEEASILSPREVTARN